MEEEVCVEDLLPLQIDVQENLNCEAKYDQSFR